MRNKIVTLPNLTLIVALALSAIAAYYSIIGLTAIFAGAMLPVIVMGGMLEVAKLTTTVWLRKYWNRCGMLLKLYLVPAVITLALITSMGIFGFLSKAHIDQGIGAGDVTAKVALIDEKIKTQKENVKAARDMLAQMDAQVNNVMNKGDSEKSAERSVQIRKQQAKERGSLQKDIEIANIEIGKLNEERAPIAAEVRAVEAEVGPIKYIAALIYGDEADTNVLEKSVRWVIILLVLVFDPLAIALILAANQSKEWELEESEATPLFVADVTMPEPDDSPSSDDHTEELDRQEEDRLIEEANQKISEIEKPEYDPTEQLIEISEMSAPKVDNFAYLKKPFVHFTNLTPIVATKVEPIEESIIEDKKEIPVQPEIKTEGVTSLYEEEWQELPGGYVTYQGKHMNKNVLRDMRPDLFALTVDNARASNNGFGTKFPSVANRGDVYVRVDTLPNSVYKFDGTKWIQVDKEKTDTYLYNVEYIKHLVNKIDKGEYDIELLSDHERQQIEEYLGKDNG